MAIGTKPKFYTCIEAFSATVYDSPEDEMKAHKYGAMPQPEVQKLIKEGLQIPRGEDIWFKAGQRVLENHPVFKGESGENRKRRLFVAEETE